MKKNNKKYFTGFLAIVFSLVLLTSCQPEYVADIYAYPEITIDAVSPASGYPGTIVRITGSNFGKYKEAAHVSFNGVPVTEFLKYEDGVMEVVVPQLAKSGKVSVQVWTDTKESVDSYTVVPLPIIGSVKSNSTSGSNYALPGDIITLTGSGFGTDASKFSITFGGNVKAEVILPVKDNEIKVIAPVGFSTGYVSYLIGGVTVIGKPAIINPNASGDITPYFLSNTGNTVSGGGFVKNGDALIGRWGTLGKPWITNSGAKNKKNAAGIAVGGFATDGGGRLVFETWGSTPVYDGKIYQQTEVNLPTGNYTLSLQYYSEVKPNSSLYLVAAAGDGLPSLGNLSSALGSVKLWNSTPVDATRPSITETKQTSFSITTPQKISIGILANIEGADVRAAYFSVAWIKLVKN